MTKNPSLPHRDTLQWLITINYRTYLSPARPSRWALTPAAPHTAGLGWRERSKEGGTEAGHCHPPQQRPGPTATARCFRSPAPLRGQQPPGPTTAATPSPVPSRRAGSSSATAALTAPGCARRAPPRPPGPGGSARSAPGSGRAPPCPAGAVAPGCGRLRVEAPSPARQGPGTCPRPPWWLLWQREAVSVLRRSSWHLPSRSEPLSETAAGVCGYNPAAQYLSVPLTVTVLKVSSAFCVNFTLKNCRPC